MCKRITPITGHILLSVALIASVIVGSPGATHAQGWPTLPPSWTPTFTPTATNTRTPTATPSITPTLDPASLCDERFFASSVDDGFSFPATGTFSVITGSDVPGTAIELDIVHRLSDETKRVDFPQPGYLGYELPVRLLPRHGLYDWTLRLVTLDGETLCEADGYFFVRIPRPTPAPPTVIVVTATPGATQTPFVIVVTATPTPDAQSPPSIRQLERTTTPLPPIAITPDA